MRAPRPPALRRLAAKGRPARRAGCRGPYIISLLMTGSVQYLFLCSIPPLWPSCPSTSTRRWRQCEFPPREPAARAGPSPRRARAISQR